MTGQRGESCARVVLGLFLALCGLAFLGWSATALFWPEQMVDGFDEPLFVRSHNPLTVVPVLALPHLSNALSACLPQVMPAPEPGGILELQTKYSL